MKNERGGTQTLQDLVREYYEDNDLPEAAVRRLASAPRHRSTAWRWTIVGAAAATVAAVALVLGTGVRRPAPPTGAGDVVPAGPKLVAVQIHADWCARSPQVAPVFAELLTRYGNEPVLFVTLDITDDVRREQARLLSSTLGIPQAFDEPFESGMIKLIDRESHVLLAAITGREQAGELSVRLAEALHVPADRRPDPDGGGA